MKRRIANTSSLCAAKFMTKLMAYIISIARNSGGGIHIAKRFKSRDVLRAHSSLASSRPWLHFSAAFQPNRVHFSMCASNIFAQSWPSLDDKCSHQPPMTYVGGELMDSGFHSLWHRHCSLEPILIPRSDLLPQAFRLPLSYRASSTTENPARHKSQQPLSRNGTEFVHLY